MALRERDQAITKYTSVLSEVEQVQSWKKQAVEELHERIDTQRKSTQPKEYTREKVHRSVDIISGDSEMVRQYKVVQKEEVRPAAENVPEGTEKEVQANGNI